MGQNQTTIESEEPENQVAGRAHLSAFAESVQHMLIGKMLELDGIILDTYKKLGWMPQKDIEFLEAKVAETAPLIAVQADEEKSAITIDLRKLFESRSECTDFKNTCYTLKEAIEIRMGVNPDIFNRFEEVPGFKEIEPLVFRIEATDVKALKERMNTAFPELVTVEGTCREIKTEALQITGNAIG